MTSLQLYKYLLRQCERLPPDACKHYKFAVKQSYKQHKSETDPDRVKEIIQKSISDAKWILKKYSNK
ncbi:jg16383 [Pararge aegeria aegeria]|uniref:LYR motif-containing protein 9 n=1 Tax=Pararge aegeria aegeria TaxID=348720 RepID=A0A8S4SES3_9NEOP|nr:jg16383 [Pararge aegeria aegeria]